ncbi:MAG: fumarylacetoacetate hydrolase family protein [Saprospiraceae bacterium]|nr:fumarylacetoacetate hydrolase family protein [Saprospiraceae bacterium]
MSESPYTSPETVSKAAERLRNAATSGQPCVPVRDLLGDTDVDAAYAVQKLNTGFRIKEGAGVVGHKIGLTSVRVQQQLGVDQPDFGVLYDDTEVMNGGAISCGTLMQPKAEAEIAFVLRRDLEGYVHTTAQVLSAVDYALAAIEIVGSRIREWDIRITDTIADNASASHFVLGHKPVPLHHLDLINCRMQMSRNDELVSTGSGSECMGSPVNALVWLANTMSKLGKPLRSGQIVLTGALGPMSPARAGDDFHAHIEGLGDVYVHFDP